MEPDEVAAKDLTLITITPADSPLQQARNLESPSNKKESYLLLTCLIRTSRLFFVNKHPNF